MAVTKIVHRILPLRVASVNRNGLELKNRISVGLRLCSSTSISCKPNKSLNSDNEIGYTDSQVHRSNIRWICKSGGKQQLFDEFLKLPNEGLSDSLNCALYWYSYYDKIEEAFELKNLMERRGISKSYSTYSILAYLFAKAGQLGSRKAFFDEMISNGLTPQARHYVPFLEAEVEKGDLVSAFEVFYEMQQSTQKHTGHSSCYRKLIRACAGREDESTTGKVLQLFDDLRKRPHFLSVEILEAVKLWFDSQENNNWVTTWSKASSSYHCQSCQYQLAEGQFTASELEQLKVHVLSHLWKTHKAVAEVKCYTSCGNFIDHMKMDRDGTFPHSIHQFLKASGPYDIVVDGLNVGYFGGGFDPGKVKIVVSHFLKENKKVLVVCSKPMSLDVRKKRGRQTQLRKLMNFLTDHCGVFCLPNRSLDDLYFLSAAMHCGPETRLVSCDRFVDHLQGLDAVTALQFKRWSRLNQLHLLKFENETPIFKDLPPFDATVQTTGDTWHFPSRNGDLWLCARKAQQWQHVEKEDSK